MKVLLMAPILLPGNILDLKQWKVTLPTGKKGSPTEVSPPSISTYTDPDFFVRDQGVVFKAACGGNHTSGSKYPRSELRELKDGKNASWDYSYGTHTMTYTASVTSLPVVKPEVVVGQIHNADDDVMFLHLHKDTLKVLHNSTDYGTLISGYKLGDKFSVEIVAERGQVNVICGDKIVVVGGSSKSKNAPPNTKMAKDHPKSKTAGCYFKLGCYTQSNPSKGDKPTAYGEVVVYSLNVKHE